MLNQITSLAKNIVDTFAQKQITLAGAESCTGGAIASAIVSISGASKVFKGSAVCYCDTAKCEILKVSKNTLDNFFAESKECAEEMAKGALNIYQSDIAFASTGFLDSNTGEKSKNLAGTVFLAVAKKSGEVFTKKILLNPNNERNQNRIDCVFNALQIILKQI